MRQQLEIEIINRLGLHARACAKLVKTAGLYSSEIWIIKEDTRADAKSIMSLMMLAASQGTRLTLIAEGADAEQAIAGVHELICDRFGEEE